MTTKGEALRQAQLDLLQNADGKYSHPVYWAPFVIIGNRQ
ncbi:MAG: CHAT domain-containing protein [Verrucomicrobia bacterium]|nr:CHAT domain-containing protein [Verrucomicrobiota bacterium]MBV8481799.1 CHAT domain-containing protein [Verrucomicrobiota bacterium]